MMQVSAKTEYGLRCLIQLARQPEGKALSIPEIAQREKLPKPYAQQILLKLSRVGLVKSLRGIQGGFTLGRSASEISVGEIVRELEGIPFHRTCDHFNRKAACGHLDDCSIREVWQLVSDRLWDMLDRITLTHLITDQKTIHDRLIVELPVLTNSNRPSSPARSV